MKITYVYHSCFTVEMKDVFLIFDYYKGDIIFPDNKKIYFFSSHRHGDHFNPVIFNFLKDNDSIKYILSYDIGRKYKKNYFLEKFNVLEKDYDNMIFLRPGSSYIDESINVETLDSTDEGVAFYVESHKKTFFHSGDLNWWSFQGEDKKDIEKMGEKFKNYLLPLKDKKIDFAFIPLDPRQGNLYNLGLEYILKNYEIKNIFPMHFGNKHKIIDTLLETELSKKDKDKIISISRKGEFWRYDI